MNFNNIVKRTFFISQKRILIKFMKNLQKIRTRDSLMFGKTRKQQGSWHKKRDLFRSLIFIGGQIKNRKTT